MQWVSNFDLFLFDFDGLLVNTEELHFKAYQQLCREKGYTLPWTMGQFFEIAHVGSEGIRRELRLLFPQLFETSWEKLYEEKKKLYETFLEEEGLSLLLPGVEPLLEKLVELGKKRCVVTNSPSRHTEAIKSRIPILQTIPRWFTRESYVNPKPAPDGYLTALRELKAPEDRVIGFEDSMRGYQALKGAGVETAVLICSPSHPQLKLPVEQGRIYAPSFEKLEL